MKTVNHFPHSSYEICPPQELIVSFVKTQNKAKKLPNKNKTAGVFYFTAAWVQFTDAFPKLKRMLRFKGADWNKYLLEDSSKAPFKRTWGINSKIVTQWVKSILAFLKLKIQSFMWMCMEISLDALCWTLLCNNRLMRSFALLLHLCSWPRILPKLEKQLTMEGPCWCLEDTWSVSDPNWSKQDVPKLDYY